MKTNEIVSSGVCGVCARPLWDESTACGVCSPLDSGPHIVECVEFTLRMLEDLPVPELTRVFTSSVHPDARGADYELFTSHELNDALEAGIVEYCEDANCYAVVTYVVFCEHSGTFEHVSSVKHYRGEFFLVRDLPRLSRRARL